MVSNPRGYPLSAAVIETEDGDVVVYRPRIAGRSKRPRIKLPEALARAFEAANGDVVKERQALRHAPKKAAKKRAKKAPKKVPKKAPYRPAHEVPPEVMAKIVADVGRRLGGRVVPEGAKKRTKRAQAKSRREPEQMRLINPSEGPDLSDLGTLTQLGHVHEMTVEMADGRHKRHKWTGDRPLLLWSPRQRALIWVVGARPHATQRGAIRDDGAARVYEKWSARSAGNTSQMTIPAASLRFQGAAVQIVYGSTKWNRRATYEHDHSAAVGTYSGGRVWAVAGGSLTITPRGIVH